MVVVEVVVVVVVELPVVLDEELALLVDAELLDEVEVVVDELAFWSCAYAPIPPEIRTRMAAAVRIWSLPVSTFMNYQP